MTRPPFLDREQVVSEDGGSDPATCRKNVWLRPRAGSAKITHLMAFISRGLELLEQARQGDGEATRELADVLYADLRRLARAALGRASSPPSIQATELVHEAFLRLAGGADVDWQSRAHFLAVAARAMRQVLIDRARKRGTHKRGGGQVPITVRESLDLAPPSQAVDVLDLEDALNRLQALDPRGAEVVVCRLFAGMQAAEIGETMGVSRRTVDRTYRTARAWLVRELAREGT